MRALGMLDGDPRLRFAAPGAKGRSPSSTANSDQEILSTQRPQSEDTKATKTRTTRQFQTDPFGELCVFAFALFVLKVPFSTKDAKVRRKGRKEEERL